MPAIHRQSWSEEDINVITINLPPISVVRFLGRPVSLGQTTDLPAAMACPRKQYTLNISAAIASEDHMNTSTSRSNASGKVELAIAFGASIKPEVVHVEWTRPRRKERTRGWAKIIAQTSMPEYAGVRAYRCTTSLVLYNPPDTSRFMTALPDSRSWADITFPGTHESCAMYGYPVSQCQQRSTAVRDQLQDGIRFLDVRLKVVQDQLLMYHGTSYQHCNVHYLLETLWDFLDQNPGESILLSLKDEVRHPMFSQMLYREMMMDKYRNLWFLEDRIPNLGEVRGKVILLCRFPIFDDDKNWTDGSGIHPSGWGDSKPEGFEWDCSGTKCRIQDWYSVPSFLQIPDKFETAIDFFEPIPITDPHEPSTAAGSPTMESLNMLDKCTPAPQPRPMSTLTLSYTSASSFPLSLPNIMAKGFGFPAWGLGIEGINSRVLGWLLGLIADGNKIKGGLNMDFYRQAAEGEVDDGVRELLVLMNTLGD